MPTTKPRYSKAEFARRGDAIYDREIAPRLEAENPGQFVSIDIESGQFEIDDDELTATHRLRARIPDAQIWLRRIGSKFARRFKYWRDLLRPVHRTYKAVRRHSRHRLAGRSLSQSFNISRGDARGAESMGRG